MNMYKIDTETRVSYPNNMFCDMFKTNDIYIEPDEFEIDLVLNILSAKQRDLLDLRYKQMKSYTAIGEKYGFTRQRAEQMIRRAFNKLCSISKKSRFILEHNTVKIVTPKLRADIDLSMYIDGNEEKYKTIAIECVSGFTLRTKNALSKHNINNVYTLMCYIESDWQWYTHIVGLGDASRDNVLYVLLQNYKYLPYRN